MAFQGLPRPNSLEFKDIMRHSMRHRWRLITVRTLRIFTRTSRLHRSSRQLKRGGWMCEHFSVVLCYSDGRLCGLLPSPTQNSKTIYCETWTTEMENFYSCTTLPSNSQTISRTCANPVYLRRKNPSGIETAVMCMCESGLQSEEQPLSYLEGRAGKVWRLPGRACDWWWLRLARRVVKVRSDQSQASFHCCNDALVSTA